MFESVRLFLQPHILANDKDEIRVVKTFDAVSLTMLVTLGLMFVGAVFIVERKAAVAAFTLAMVTLIVVSRIVLRRGRIVPASTVLVSGMWICITLQICLTGSLDTAMSGGYIALVVIAGMLLGPRAAVVFACLSSVTGLGIIFLPYIGYPLYSYYPMPPRSAGFILICWFFLTVPVIYITIRGLNNAVSAARQETEERRSAELTLRKSEERYRLHFDNIKDVIFSFDSQFRILDVSPSIEVMTGYRRDEVVGKPFYELKVLHPDYLSKALEEAKRVLAGAYIDTEVYGFIHKEGTITYAELSGSPLRREGKIVGAVCVARDITERMETERALQQSEHKHHAILENIEEGYFEVDLSGNMVFCNDPLMQTLGYSRDELIGMNNRQYMDEETARKVFSTFNSVYNTGKAITVTGWKVLRKDGNERSIEASVSLIRDSEGAPCGFFGIARDVTERERLQEERIQAQKMEAIGTLAGGIAHDFNNLLQAMLGYSDLLLVDKPPGDPDREKLEVIRNAARDGADLVSRILTFSRKVEPHIRPIDLNEEIRKAYELLRRTVPRMIEIKLVLDKTLWIIDADPGQVEQVLLNLAVNAQHAMPDGGQLLIETRNVSLSDKYLRTHLKVAPGHYVLLTVSDTGIGMESNVMERIFEPFFTTKTSGEGTGLGLSMVHGIVSQHGGHIRCYSEPSSGTSFKIYFPVAAKQSNSNIAMTREMPAFGTETILPVDDDERVRALGRQLIETGGYKVITACNGEEAVETYRSREQEIELVILDLIMPGMGGQRCLEQLLQMDPDVKVLVASGYSPNGKTSEEYWAGARGFITKPYDTKEILAAIRKVLD
jgi:two-component system cell cycle sensor histidine kinase/response regulator CckA